MASASLSAFNSKVKLWGKEALEKHSSHVAKVAWYKLTLLLRANRPPPTQNGRDCYLEREREKKKTMLEEEENQKFLVSGMAE